MMGRLVGLFLMKIALAVYVRRAVGWEWLSRRRCPGFDFHVIKS